MYGHRYKYGKVILWKKGIEDIVSLNRNINSDNAWRKFDGQAEARIIKIAYSPSKEDAFMIGRIEKVMWQRMEWTLWNLK